MVMKWRPTVALTVVMVMIMLSIPTSSAYEAASAECDNVTVMTFADNIKISVLESTDFTINIHNGNDVPVMVNITQDDDSPIKVGVDGNIVVDAGKTVIVNGTLTPKSFCRDGDYGITLKIDVIKGETAPSSTELGFTVTTVSSISSNGYYKTFMGLFALPEPIDGEIWCVLFTAIGWIVLATVASIVGSFVLRTIGRRFESGETKIDSWLLRSGIFIMVIATGVTNLARVMAVDYKLLATIEMVMSFVYIFTGAIIAWDIYKVVVAYFLRRAERYNTEVNTSLIPLTHLLGKIIITLVVVTYILSKLGVNLAGMIAGAGVATLGVSLGAKPVINEFFSGLVVLTTRPFVKDDIIRVEGGDALTVKKVGIMKTTFYTGYSNDTISLPNSMLTSKAITNISWVNRNYRNTLNVRVPISCDIELAKRLIRESAEENPNVLKAQGDIHGPVVVVSDTNDHGAMVLTLACYFKAYGDSFDDMGTIRETVLKKFYENGIHIPGHMTISNIMGVTSHEE